MNTEELIRQLSSNLSPVPRGALEKRLLLGVAAGFLGSAILLTLWLGLRPDFQTAVTSHAFLIKIFYTTALAVSAIAACIHLMRPDAKPVLWLAFPLIPVALLGALATAELAGAPREAWSSLIFERSGWACIVRISIISVPAFFGIVWAARNFAPTRLRAAGAAIGFASGSLAAALYALYCIETSASFIFLWYSLAIFIVATLGAFVGPRILRW